MTKRVRINVSSHETLIAFTDFIYAVVFGIIVQQTFENLIDNNEIALSSKFSSLLLLAAVFYLLVWDWILGRLLTLRNPYESYTPFFCEVLIAAFSYGAASAATQGNTIFLLHFAFILFFGGLWARRMEKKILEKRDSQEFCMIQILQFTGSMFVLFFYFWWSFFYGRKISWALILIIVAGGWSFIFVYEILVPRYSGMTAGPGVPFIGRSRVRKLRRVTSSVFQ
jgi:hypothetical protein